MKRLKIWLWDFLRGYACTFGGDPERWQFTQDDADTIKRDQEALAKDVRRAVLKMLSEEEKRLDLK